MNSKEKGVMVYCHPLLSYLNINKELLYIGRQLALELHESVTCVLLGPQTTELQAVIESLSSLDIDRIIICLSEEFEYYRGDLHARILSEIATQEKPRVLLADASLMGRDIASRTAAILQTGLTADCTALSIHQGFLLQTRPAFYGNINASIICDKHSPQIATIRPGTYPSLEDSGTAVVIEYCPSSSDLKSRIRPVSDSGLLFPDHLITAPVIIGVGKGIHSSSDLSLIQELAKELNASVVASRGAVDSGLFPYSAQVGQTGRTIHTKLYLACGISGSAHHLAGVRANQIFAINHDPDAPIFSKSDYGICDDLKTILPQLIKIIRLQRKSLETPR